MKERSNFLPGSNAQKVFFFKSKNMSMRKEKKLQIIYEQINKCGIHKIVPRDYFLEQKLKN